MHGFQSHGVGQGCMMQGIHGFLMQGVPYYHIYPPNPPFYQGIYPQGDEHPSLAMHHPIYHHIGHDMNKMLIWYNRKGRTMYI